MKTCPQCDTGYPDSYSTCPTHGVPLNEIRDLKPGMIIRQSYRIIRKLGHGGMGAVYLAQHLLMNEPRALKFLAAEYSLNQDFTARFLREVRTLRQIRNRNVVDCGDLEAAEDGSLFFSMEFVDGPDLRKFLHESPKPFNIPLALNIIRQVAEGLGAAHAKGMVHRDIKPENVLMTRDKSGWVPKIADFGIVATKESSTFNTRTGGTLLTMFYAAPEQWRGTPAAELDGRTDLYALGGLLFEMLTGRTAFHAENYEGWSWQHQNTPPQPPSILRPDLAHWQGLDALVLRLLAKNRNDRPKDVAELLTLLDAVRLVPSEAHRETVKEDGKHVGGRRSRRIPIWVWAVSVAMFLVAGFYMSRILVIRLRTGQQPKQALQQSSSTVIDHDALDKLAAKFGGVREAQAPAQSAAAPVIAPAAHVATGGLPPGLSPPPPGYTYVGPAPARERIAKAWTDPATGLMWTKEDNSSNVDWQHATDYCRNLQLDGRSGWRLPTIDELRSIYDPNANLDDWHVKHVKGKLQLSAWQWSSSPGNAPGEAWSFNFDYGERNSIVLGSGIYSVRALCVRRSGE